MKSENNTIWSIYFNALVTENPHPPPPPTPGRRGAYVGICKCLYDFLISHFQSLILQNHGAVTASAVKVNVPVTI